MKKRSLDYCPTCCSPKMARRKGARTFRVNGRKLVLRNAEYDCCLACGEVVMDRESVRELQTQYYGQPKVAATGS